MTNAEIRAIAMEVQPALGEWLQARLEHLDFVSAMRVVELLCETGALAAGRAIMRESPPLPPPQLPHG